METESDVDADNVIDELEPIDSADNAPASEEPVCDSETESCTVGTQLFGYESNCWYTNLFRFE